MNKILIGIVTFIAIIGLWMFGTYNTLIGKSTAIDGQWAQVETQYQRRFDLIPNLVETVKGYKNFEQETLIAVTKARSAVQGVPEGNVADRAKAEGELGAALSRLMVVVERYPELKANQNFLALQEELTGTENRISFSRQAYNDSVLQYNNKTQQFPSNIVASMFNFKKEQEFLQATENEAEKKAPKVSF